MKLSGLKNIRKIYGFTMRELAERLKVSANAINIWETGDLDVPEHRLDELSNFFRLSKEYFLKDKHSAREIIEIEIGRTNFKIEEYKSNIKNDDKFIDDTMRERINKLKITKESIEENYNDMISSLKELISVYSSTSKENYSELMTMLNTLIIHVDDGVFMKKLYLAYNSISNNENDISDCKGYTTTGILQRQIRENVELLHRIETQNNNNGK